jgi:two-component system, NarL family, sensor kinase
MSVNVLIAIGILGMLSLAMGIIFFVVLHQRKVFQHQMEMLASQKSHEHELRLSTLEAQEQTLGFVASELHDDIGVMLSSVKLFLSKVSRHSEEAQLIDHTKGLLDECIQKIRGLSQQLHPTTLQHLGLSTAIESMCDIVKKTGSVKCNFKTTYINKRLSENVELALYRVVQELLNNILKHSNASSIDINISATGNIVSIQLFHDGKGLTDETFQSLLYSKGGLGLKNISNRIKTVNAAIHFEQITEKKYCVSITSPVNV